MINAESHFLEVHEVIARHEGVVDANLLENSRDSR